MRIVVTVPYTPWPVRRGTGRLIVNLLEGLSGRHEVTLVTMTLTVEELESLGDLERSGVKVRAMMYPHRRSGFSRLHRKVRNVLLESFAGIPQEISYNAPREFLELIASAASEGAADVVLASYWHMYRLPEFVTGSRLALVTHDLNYIGNRHRIDLIPQGMQRRRFERGMKMLGKYEIAAYERFETILTVTAGDAGELRSVPTLADKKIMPLPLALDLSLFSPPVGERRENRILLLGSFHSDFNRDALRFFASDVFPLVRREVPEAILEVVGEGVDENTIAEGGSGIVFTGGVDDITSYLGRCSLMVLPLRYSGGVRIRMLEAAAMGTPVVSTPPGVAGMGLRAGEDYLEATDAASMAEAVVSLLRDAEKAAALGRSARGWAVSNISMEDYPDRLDTMIRAITGQ
jgi:glycosyltransferase involved in cell wall biosynthesis